MSEKETTIKKEMAELVDKLNEYAYFYYVLDKPRVDDGEYDRLYDALQVLEKSSGIVLANSPSLRIGGTPLKAFAEHRHKSKLYSLDKVKTLGELQAWCAKTKTALEGKEIEYSLEYKLDGLTLCLTYDKGCFVRATTRGNGETGEDVTRQVRTIPSVPMTVPFQGFFEVQGEGVIHLSSLQAYNQQNPQDPLKNARNGAAGAIRNLDPQETKKRGVQIYFYHINYIEAMGDQGAIKTQRDVFVFLEQNGFASLGASFFCDVNLLCKHIQRVERGTLDFLIDGMVVKVCDQVSRQVLGNTIKFPKWAMAYKFEAEEVSTTVQEVVWAVGRTGKITPTAILQPIDVGGVTVKRATLNNYDDIVRKKVGIGSTVFLRRSNDVIPEILYGVEGTATQEIAHPQQCPQCGGEV
ncbi:MAG: NAD-dependent DNA ligase LigA, partial [Firmicutes bacterium]|nr:NAD-dependent DNA ligase LigA [Bacillota bacterium]